MRSRTSLLQNKGISSNSTYFRKTIKTNDILPISNPNLIDETKDHGSLIQNKRQLAMLCTFIAVTVCFFNNFNKNMIGHGTTSKSTKKSKRASLTEGKVADPNSIDFSMMLSYPDSNSDFVSNSVHISSGLATAVNYAQDTPERKFKSIFSMNIGPYLPEKTSPTEHVLTSTSCGRWPSDGSPESYLFKTIEIFEKNCFAIQLFNSQTNEIESKSSLSQNSVKKIIHVVMNPFTNVISRFNHQNDLTDKSFQNWCESLDQKFSEKESSMFTETESALMENVPCHAEFYRFISWHNFAFSISRYLGLPSVMMNVESFDEDYDGSLDRLLEFLEVPEVGNQATVKVQFPAIDDSKYYSTKQRKSIMKLVKQLSSEDTWDSLKVYFPEINDVLDNEIAKIETDVAKYTNVADTEQVAENKLKDISSKKANTTVNIGMLEKEKMLAYIPKKKKPNVHKLSMDAASPNFSFDVQPVISIDKPKETDEQDQKMESKDSATADSPKPMAETEEIKQTVSEINDVFIAKEKEKNDFTILQSMAESENSDAEKDAQDEVYYKKSEQTTIDHNSLSIMESEATDKNAGDVVYYKTSEQTTSKKNSLTDIESETEHTDTLHVEELLQNDKEDKNVEESEVGTFNDQKSYAMHKSENSKSDVDVESFVASNSQSFDVYLEKMNKEGKANHEGEGKQIAMLNNMDTVLDKYVEEKSEDGEKSSDPNFERLAAPVKRSLGPKVAWLLTFPSSGTTYTSKLIRMASQTTTGTNYGNEYVNDDGVSVPLFSDSKGPYIVDETLSVPSTYILTKTHCGSRCVDCGPQEYIETVDQYLEKCLRAPKVVKDNPDTKEIQVANGVTQSIEFLSYDYSVVRKIVHVIKDPYDNIVSRFYHEYKSLVQKFDSKDKFPYSYDKEGFQSFCKDEDKRYLEEEASVYNEKLRLLSTSVPCHADFYRYVQWHNHAFGVAEKLNIDSHAINYEDYSDKLEDTVSDMLEYLELPKASKEELAPFKWESAHDHFSKEQMQSIALFVQELANGKTWGYLKDYFSDSIIHETTEDKNDESTFNKDSSIDEGLDFKRLTAPVISTAGPKVAWLMSFPSSGARYTSKLIRMASQTTTGTNYGNEYVNTYGESVSLYSDIKGPYIVNETLSVPSTYILTKTHCGSRCVDCGPKDYVENADKFMESCLRAPKVKNDVETKEVQIANGVSQSLDFVSYDPSIVRKIVHVIKDPFDNIVSRFHHEYKSLVQKYDSKDKFPYSYDIEGFQEYCKDEDKRYLEEEKIIYSETIHLISKHVPCHADFYRYVQWHNLAFEVAEKLSIDSYAINYEDYSDKLDETVSGMLKYLELPKASKEELAPFRWESAHDHFDKLQMNTIALFVHELASDKTWKYMKNYFNNFSSVDRIRLLNLFTWFRSLY